MTDDTMENPARRDFLGDVTMAVAGAGLAAACWPLISSMNPSTNVASQATSTVDLSEIPPGTEKTVAWQGKPVFVLHRTEAQIDEVRRSAGIKDPEADKDRIIRPDWLVVVGICTHLGCVPNRSATGWLCPCHGSIFDNSGRIISGPAPSNLVVPHYEFKGNDEIIIGKA